MKWYAPLIIFFLIIACTPQNDLEPPTNPYDPDNPDYETPLATIIESSVNSDTIITDIATFRWIGNNDDCQFAYRLDDNSWSAWGPDTFTTFDYLDEDTHTFQVKARYPTGEEQTIPDEIGFIVDAIKGPSLWISPKKVETTENSPFSVYVMVEEVENLSMLSIKLNYNSDYLQIQAYEILENESFLYSYQLISAINENINGELTVYLALAGDGTESLSGSGTILRLDFNPVLKGTTQISFDENCSFREYDNTIIEIYSKTSSTVTIR